MKKRKKKKLENKLRLKMVVDCEDSLFGISG